MRLRQRAAEHREVLREQKDRPPVHRAVPGDDAVAQHLVLGHAEVGAAVRDQLVHLDEAARIAKPVDALARGQLARLVLALGALGSAGGRCLPFQRFQRREPPVALLAAAQILGLRRHVGSPSRPCT